MIHKLVFVAVVGDFSQIDKSFISNFLAMGGFFVVEIVLRCV
jgi:methanogenic corrinoid protein MtbC1